MCAFDVERRLAYANATARRFWSLGQDEYVGRTLPELGRRTSLSAVLHRQLERALKAGSGGAEGVPPAMPSNGTESGIAFGFTPVEVASAPRLMLVWLREIGATERSSLAARSE